MLVSRNILSKYVDLKGISDQEIAQKLTFAGIEVEDYYPLAIASNLVVGQIKQIDNVEGSDHLHLLQVDLGPVYGVNQIICGAPNVKLNAKVIVAREGAVLKDITIKKAKIHGHESNGMCCSLIELGVDEKYLSEEDKTGIHILSDDSVVGSENVLAELGLDDSIFDIKPLANRSDVLAIYNLARELGAIFDRKVEIPTYEVRVSRVAKAKVESKTDKCPQFAIKEMYGIKVGPSPKWLQEALIALGQRPINNIVDIGNYVMLLTGQPLHMYDIDKLSSLNFNVRNDVEGEFVGLDNKTYQLEKGDICVLTDDTIVGIAGVLGGLNSAVTAETTNVAIEAAYFERASIRVTSIRLNLMSEASQRFAKGINPHQAEEVLNFAAKLVEELCGVTAQSNIVNDDNLNHSPFIIEVKCSYLNNLLGTEFTKETIVATLEKLNMKVTERNETLYVVIPPYRIDITSKADLAEEIIRLQGFYNVKSELPSTTATIGGYSEVQQKTNLLRKFMQSRALHEVLTYTLVSEQEVNMFKYLNKEKAVQLAHPMTPDHKFLRLNLLPSILSVAQYNYARQQSNFALFETSDVYSEKGNEKHLAAVLVGDKLSQGLIKKKPFDFYDAKGLLEAIFALLDIKESRYSILPYDLGGHEFHPGRSAKVMLGNKLVAVLGEVHPRVLNERNFNKTAVVALEIVLDELFDLKVSQTKMAPIALYPSVTRDLALVVDEAINIKNIIEEVKKVDRKIIKNVDVFDIYRGASLGENIKSVALKITYQDDVKTLVDIDIKQVEEKVKLALDKKFGVKLRS